MIVSFDKVFNITWKAVGGSPQNCQSMNTVIMIENHFKQRHLLNRWCALQAGTTDLIHCHTCSVQPRIGIQLILAFDILTVIW